MGKTLRCKLVLVVCGAVLCLGGGCQRADVGVREPVDVSRWLVAPELLSAGGLEIAWETRLPIRGGESLAELIILDGRIYSLSSDNYLVSMNRENGSVVFSMELAARGIPVVGLGMYKDVILSIVGNRLVEINPESGEELSGKELSVHAVCPPAGDNKYFYVGGADKRVHALRAEDKVQVFEVAARGVESGITSIIAGDEFVVFATDRGHVVRIEPLSRKEMWEFKAGEGVIGPMVQSGRSLYLASKDTHVYKVDLVKGRGKWKYQAGGALESSPVVTKGIVLIR